MNTIGLRTIALKELRRTFSVFFQAVLSPVITTALYFVVFGAAIGSHIGATDGVAYRAFIVPGLILMTVIPNALSASSSGIYFQKFTGAMVYLLSAPLALAEVATGYVIAAAARGLIIGGIVYAIGALFGAGAVAHPLAALVIVAAVALTFATMGFSIGIIAKDFEQLAFVPTIILTPLTFLGGVFYSVTMLPPLWQTITIANPIYYMVDALRWAFFGTAHSDIRLSVLIIGVTFALSLTAIAIIFRTGYKIKP